MVADVVTLDQIWSPHIVVRETMEFGGCIAAEYLGKPHATVQVGPYCPPEPPWELVGSELAGLCRQWGMPAERPFDMLYRYLHLSCAPPSFQNQGVFVPATNYAIQFSAADTLPSEPLPRWLRQAPQQPRVYASLGTVSATFDGRTEHVHRIILEGLRSEPLDLVLTIGQDRDPRRFPRQPPNVHIERYVPQSLLFPHCQLAVTHGGYSTVLTAISHGLPLVMVPLFADQAENARRCAALGLGRIVEPAMLTPETLRATVYDVLRDAAYRANAMAVRDEMQSLPKVDSAIPLLERLAAQGAPRLSRE